MSLHESQAYINSEAESHIQNVQSKAGGDAEQAIQYAALCRQELQTMKEEMLSNTIQYNECLSEFAEFEMSARNSNLEAGVELAMARSTGQIFYHEVEANSRMMIHRYSSGRSSRGECGSMSNADNLQVMSTRGNEVYNEVTWSLLVRTYSTK